MVDAFKSRAKAKPLLKTFAWITHGRDLKGGPSHHETTPLLEAKINEIAARNKRIYQMFEDIDRDAQTIINKFGVPASKF